MDEFKISIPEETLADLEQRLSRTRWPTTGEGEGWAAGADLANVRHLVEYWLDGYDWRATEASLNDLPQYIVDLDGFRLHFAYVQGEGPAPVPLLFNHGWPGTFAEIQRIIGPLTDPAAHGGDPADAFTVVAPSLPGFVFSTDPGGRAGSPSLAADLFSRLMADVLGHERFLAQGGDFGAMITAHLGHRHPRRMLGLHLNLGAAAPVIDDSAPPLSEEERRFLDESAAWASQEMAYAIQQQTKPQTLAYALSDSPVGLLAWMAEKYHSWTDRAGVPDDDILTAATLYWVTGSLATSARWYYNTRTSNAGRPILRSGERIEVPTAYARFPAEILRPPRAYLERVYDIRRFTDFAVGGHFPALEQPEALVEDLRAFARELRG